MIKAIGMVDGRPLLALGLTHDNLHRLSTGGEEGLGEPMYFNLGELGLPPLRVVILAGEDDEALLATLKRFGLPMPGTPGVL
jgi:hypothetical protein